MRHSNPYKLEFLIHLIYLLGSVTILFTHDIINRLFVTVVAESQRCKNIAVCPQLTGARYDLAPVAGTNDGFNVRFGEGCALRRVMGHVFDDPASRDIQNIRDGNKWLPPTISNTSLAVMSPSSPPVTYHTSPKESARSRTVGPPPNAYQTRLARGRASHRPTA